MLVYKATNTINGKIYIGKTVRTLSHAKARHKQRAIKAWKYGCNSRFYSAIRKHGFNNFIWEIIYIGSSDEDIQEKEKYYIAELKSFSADIGYNMTLGGDGGAGKILTDEHKNKLKISSSGENNWCFGRFGKDHPAYGYRHSKNAKEKIRVSNTGKKLSINTKNKISIARLRKSKFTFLDREKMLDMINSGSTYREVADKFGVKNTGTIYDLIQVYLKHKKIICDSPAHDGLGI